MVHNEKIDIPAGEIESEAPEVVEEAPAAREDLYKVAFDQMSPEDRLIHLRQLTSDGKDNMAEEDFEEASHFFSLAAELSNMIYGVEHPDTFEYHFRYGQALLDTTRQQNQVLGKATAGISTTDEGSTSKDTTLNASKLEQIIEEVHGALAETAEALKKGAGDDNTEGKDTAEASASTETATSEVDADAEKDEAEEGKEAEKEEDANNAEEAEKPEGEAEAEDDATAAYEVFEQCRLILEAQPQSDERDLRMSDVFLHLGAVEMEGDNYDKALEEMHKALEWRQRLNASGRALAEVYAMMARCYNTIQDYNQAISAYDKLKESLNAAIAEQAKEAPNQTEIEELQSILSDSADCRADTERDMLLAEEYAKAKAGTTSETVKIPTAPVDGNAGDAIQVRRAPKRPASTDPSEDTENQDAKKPKEVDAPEQPETPNDNVDGSIATA
ncbi:unnamed protein product, partial [Mesorhabditis spiculigera]